MAARRKTAGRKTARKAAPKAPRKAKSQRATIDELKARNQRLDRVAVDLIGSTAQDVHTDIRRRRKPDMTFPVRSLRNVSYSQQRGYFEIGRQKKVRTLTVNTVKGFAQTLRMMGLSKELIETNDFATKRDAYYQSKNWEEAKFDDQPESDSVMDDIEAMLSVRGVSREQLRFVPDEHSNGCSRCAASRANSFASFRTSTRTAP
jgi:DNA topoisomerase-6 subunit A